MARKKARSVKQKANDRRLGQMAKKRARKSTPKRRKATPRKTIKRAKRRSPVARKKTRRSSSGGKGSGFINKIPLLKNKTVQRIGFGLGMGSIAGIIASKIPVPIVQQNANIISTGVAFATDPLAGVVKLALSGGLGNLGGLIGGNSNGQMADNGGFA